MQFKKQAIHVKRYFSKEDIQMADRYMKKCLISLAIRKCKSKTEKISPNSSKNYYNQRQKMTISDEEVEKRKLSLIVGGNVNLVQLWKPVLRFLRN
jgi:transcriptional regulator of heat shock response